MTDHDHGEQDEASCCGFLVAFWGVHQVVDNGCGIGETGG